MNWREKDRERDGDRERERERERDRERQRETERDGEKKRHVLMIRMQSGENVKRWDEDVMRKLTAVKIQ